MAAVEHQIAGHLQHAVGTQVAHHQPEFFHIQLGVAATLEVQVAVEHAVLQLAVGEELGFPLVGRAEQLKRCVGSDQFHGGGGVNRDVGIEEIAAAGAVERHGGHRQRLAADLVGFQRLLNLVRQTAIGGSQWQAHRQQQAGNSQATQGLDHGRQPSS